MKYQEKPGKIKNFHPSTHKQKISKTKLVNKVFANDMIFRDIFTAENDHFCKFGEKTDQNGPKIWVKWTKIKNPRNKFCLYSKTLVSCKIPRKLKQMTILRLFSRFFKYGISYTFSIFRENTLHVCGRQY